MKRRARIKLINLEKYINIDKLEEDAYIKKIKYILEAAKNKKAEVFLGSY